MKRHVIKKAEKKRATVPSASTSTSRIQSLPTDLLVSCASFLDQCDHATLARTCRVARYALSLGIRNEKASPGLQRIYSVVIRCLVNSQQNERLKDATLTLWWLACHTHRLKRLKIVIDDVHANPKAVSRVETLFLPELPATLDQLEIHTKWDFTALDTNQLLKALKPCAERLRRLDLMMECVCPNTPLPDITFPELRYLRLEWTGALTCPLFAMSPALETLVYDYGGTSFNLRDSETPDTKHHGLKELTLRLRKCQTISLLDCASLKSFACHESCTEDIDDDPDRYILPATVEQFHLNGWKDMPNVWMTLSNLRRLEMNVDWEYSADMGIPTLGDIMEHCPLLESFVFHNVLVGQGDIQTVREWIVGLGTLDEKQSSYPLPHLQLFVVCNDVDMYGYPDFWDKRKKQIGGCWYMIGICIGSDGNDAIVREDCEMLRERRPNLQVFLRARYTRWFSHYRPDSLVLHSQERPCSFNVHETGPTSLCTWIQPDPVSATTRPLYERLEPPRRPCSPPHDEPAG